MAYQVTNIGKVLIYENLDTPDAVGKPEVFSLGVRETKTISDEQWASRAVQRHLTRKRLRSKKV